MSAERGNISPDEWFEEQSKEDPTAPPKGKKNGKEGGAKSKSARPKRIKLIPFEELRFEDHTRYLIKGLFPRRGVAVVYGPPKGGKSFWMTSIAMHVALGWNYRGRKVKQGTVVYCAFEGQWRFADRLVAFRQTFLKDHTERVPFFLQPLRLDLIKDHEELIEAIRPLADPPTLIVLDTLNRSLKGSERDDKDMGSYIAAAEALREAFDCLVAIVHHSGLDTGRPRGHTSLAAAADTQIQVYKDAEENVVAEVELMKDGSADAKDISRLEVVIIGVDQDGDDVTSCVLREVEGSTDAKPKVKIPPSAKVALELLWRAIVDAGTVPPASNNIPPNTRTVSLTLWRTYCDHGTVANSDKPNTLRKTFARAAECLQSAKLIGVWSDQVWPTGRQS